MLLEAAVHNHQTESGQIPGRWPLTSDQYTHINTITDIWPEAQATVNFCTMSSWKQAVCSHFPCLPAAALPCMSVEAGCIELTWPLTLVDSCMGRGPWASYSHITCEVSSFNARKAQAHFYSTRKITTKRIHHLVWWHEIILCLDCKTASWNNLI